ncbi:hypothetical protein EAH72_17000 [Pseudomonas caspiana]|nr:hypothetical protein [Pseudomonas caspiana]TPG94638.1 hypothetical protein EAH72_17000 [Pseudomonas caspiana]
MGSKAILEWSYIPSDLIDGVLDFEKYGGKMVAQDGRAKAEFDECDYRADTDLAGKLLQALQAKIAPIERRKHRAAQFSTLPTLTVMRSDGVSEVYLEGNASVTITEHLVLQLIRDGVVIVDSAQERADEEMRQGEKLERHADDALLSRMLASHRNAMNDRNDEFVHLYEILDALEKKFGKLHRVADALAFDVSRLRAFQACCNTPTTASRHRGNVSGPLRSPTQGEYETARSVAWDLVMAYATFLDSHCTGSA